MFTGISKQPFLFIFFSKWRIKQTHIHALPSSFYSFMNLHAPQPHYFIKKVLLKSVILLITVATFSCV